MLISADICTKRGNLSNKKMACDPTLYGIRCNLAASRRSKSATPPTACMHAMTHLVVYAMDWLHQAAPREKSSPTTNWPAMTHYMVYAIVWLHGCRQEGSTSNIKHASVDGFDGIRYDLVARDLRNAARKHLPLKPCMHSMTDLMVYAVARAPKCHLECKVPHSAEH